MCVEARVAGSATRERVQRTKCNRVSRRSAPAVWWSLRGGAKLARKRSRVGVLRSTLHSVTRRASGRAGLMEGEKILQTSMYVARVDRPNNNRPTAHILSTFGQRHVLSQSFDPKTKQQIFLSFLPIDFFSYIYMRMYAYIYIHTFLCSMLVYIFIWVCPRRTERSICHLSLGKVS